jgi:hypothetical protein
MTVAPSLQGSRPASVNAFSFGVCTVGLAHLLETVLGDRSFCFHEESAELAKAPVDQVFAYLDDPRALASHMGKSSILMMGTHMLIDVDAGDGRSVGSKIRMQGRVMGIPLSLEEVITVRRAPRMKVWETIGTPSLPVLANYRMGFNLTHRGDSSLLRVFIDYSLPTHAPGAWLGRLLGSVYGRWCTKEMAHDAVKHFNSRTAGST